MGRSVSPGVANPLGATVQSGGTNFAIFSDHAEAVELCLFDSAETTAACQVLELPGRTGGVYHGCVAGVVPGQVYGYRVRGPWKPHSGHRFDPSKVLLDPYARAIAREPRWDASMYSYAAGSYPDESALGRERNLADSAGCAPLAVVVDMALPGHRVKNPGIPWDESVIYELHVRGFTKLHSGVPAAQRGTYAGLASEPVLEYLVDLGITAVELLPVQQHANDHWLENKGLTNYWGYQPLAYFAPESSYSMATGAGAVTEFRAMVDRFHECGLEIILDVVYNHTAEGNHAGPTLSFRGIDNASYYRLDPADKRKYLDFTGCGNTLNTHHPAVVRLVLDSLRYWVEVMGVDGFRFDLAVSLGRVQDRFDRFAPLLTAIEQDPVLRSVKLVAEPWDLGGDGDQLGGFPSEWAEWNRAFRTDTRRFWRGDAGVTPWLATRLAGSADIFRHRRRSPQAGINFVTAHDGFTLADLVCYTHKRNDGNGEGGRDGEHENDGWNCGAEGPTAAPAVLALRNRQRRNLMATLLLAQGVPMLLAGDEFGRTQHGNNNAYCQDNEISWVDWSLADSDPLLGFTRELIRLRASSPVLRRTSFFDGVADQATGVRDVVWLRSDGHELSLPDWSDATLDRFGMMLAAAGQPTYLILLNSSDHAGEFTLPAGDWTVRVDTRSDGVDRARMAGGSHLIESRSLVLLQSDVPQRLAPTQVDPAGETDLESASTLPEATTGG